MTRSTTPIHGRRRAARTFAAVLLIGAVTGANPLVAAAPADAASRAAAERFARRAADRYTDDSFGISGGAKFWDVDCERRGHRRWWCGVTSLGGQCFGHLRLREYAQARFTAYGHKIACLE